MSQHSSGADRLVVFRLGTRASRTLALVVSAATLSLALAACGSSASSSASSSVAGSSTASSKSTSTSGGGSSSGVAAAQAKNTANLAAPSGAFVAPGPPLNAKSLRGKSLWYVPVSAAIPELQVEVTGIQQAAAKLGMSYHTCDGKFLPAAQATCITQAVNAGAGGIITDSIDPTTVGTAVSSAASHKIPIVASSNLGPSTPYLQSQTLGDSESSAPAADWMIAHSGGKAHVLSVTITGYKDGQDSANALYAELQKNCPGCVVYKNELPQASAFTILQSASSTALLKHPDADYGFPNFDAMYQLFDKGAQTAGRKLTVISTSAVLANLQQIKAGTGQQKADVGANRNYLGWETVDRLLRMMLGKPEPTHGTVPIRVFDTTNINSIALTNDAWLKGLWWGPTTYQQDFAKLWGVG